MPRKKSKKNMYFDMDVQDAIVKYNGMDSKKEAVKRSKLYQEEIHAAFDKLCENIINTFKFTYFDDPFEDVKNEVVAFLVMNMHKYDHTKGAKAFSYFSVVAKNYLILHNNNNYKKYKSHDNINVLEKWKNLDNSEEGMSHFTECLIKYFDENISTMFKKKRDINIAYAILELLKKRDGIENFNKKSLYILIREMTNVNTSNITTVVNVFKTKYKKLVNEYHSTGYLRSDKKTFF